jgi:transposase
MERRDYISLSQKEQRRLKVVSEMEAGHLSEQEARELLGISARQLRRLRLGFKEEGAAAFVHGNRGRASVHRLSDELRGQVVALGSGAYAACNDSHMSELLAVREGILVSRASVQRIRRQAGQKPKQRRRPPKHRSRRDRRPQEGMLLQIDGSPHHWLGEDQPRLTLLGAIDDATGKVTAALFREQEDAQGYFLLLRQVIEDHGVPLDLYHDRHSTFQVNPKTPLSMEDQLAGKPAQTQFGRALDELCIGSIAAHSPQAKGRIERLWHTFQDRLVAELALAGIKDIRAAHRFLPGFIKRHNARFAVQAEEPGLAYRALDPGLDLDRVISFRYQRVVAQDNTVRLEGHLIQIPPGPGHRSYARARVWVHELLDGSLGVWYQDQWLVRGKASALARVRARNSKPALPERAPALTPPLPLAVLPSSAPQKTRPPHPWKTYNPGYLNRSRTESLSS